VRIIGDEVAWLSEPPMIGALCLIFSRYGIGRPFATRGDLIENKACAQQHSQRQKKNQNLAPK
jgi:hypothetical protein